MLTLGNIFVLMLLVLSKNVYSSSLTSFFTFYLIDRVHLSVQDAQVQLFLFMAAVAVGTLAKHDQGAWWVDEVVLKPRIVYGGDKGAPSAEEAERLHHAAHEECFIANSVKTRITMAAPD